MPDHASPTRDRKRHLTYIEDTCGGLRGNGSNGPAVAPGQLSAESAAAAGPASEADQLAQAHQRSRRISSSCRTSF